MSEEFARYLASYLLDNDTDFMEYDQEGNCLGIDFDKLLKTLKEFDPL